jgi:hypothetical protein
MGIQHHAEEVSCPTCGQLSSGGHGAHTVRAERASTAVYLHQGQLVPMARTGEVLDEVCGCPLSQGTLLRRMKEASERLAATVEKIAD